VGVDSVLRNAYRKFIEFLSRPSNVLQKKVVLSACLKQRTT
jgi:hypothetical protein